MRKFIALLLSVMMLALPVASFAEEETVQSISVSVSDLVVTLGDMKLDFTGMTEAQNFATDGIRQMLGFSVTAGEKTALEMDALVEGTVLTMALFNAEDQPVNPALTLDAAPYIEKIQQQIEQMIQQQENREPDAAEMQAAGAMQELMATLQEIADGAETGEPYETDVIFPDGSTVAMTLADITLPEESVGKFIQQALTFAGQEMTEVPELEVVLTIGQNEEGSHMFYQGALTSEGQTLKGMVFGAVGETLSYDEVVMFGENTLSTGNVTLAAGEAGFEMSMKAQVAQYSMNAQANVQPSETGAAGQIAVSAAAATAEGETQPLAQVSCSFDVKQEEVPASQFAAAADAMKSLPAVNAEVLQNTESEEAQKVLGAWMAAGMEGLQVLQEVPAVQTIMSFVSMLTQAAQSSGAEIAQ